MIGYMGFILKVDLSSGTIDKEVLTEDIARKYIGGSGLGAKYLCDLTDGNTDPLGPENALIFMTGPLTGTKAFSSDRFQVVTKSPQTGIFGEANCGGKWGSWLKRSGFDGIVIVGKATKPTYIEISNSEVKLHDASELWRLDTFRTDQNLKEIAKNPFEAVYIGPAGEKLVRYSVVSSAGAHARVAARSGCGAVMGSKNLKAIVVGGNRKFDIHDPAGLRQYIKKHAKEVADHPISIAIRDAGTSCGLADLVDMGNVPIKNWSSVSFPGADKIDGFEMRDTILTNKYYCGSCVVGCGRTIEIPDGKYKTDGKIGGPEYESAALLGSNLLISDLGAVCKLNELCNRYGMDTISAGSAIGMAMECYDGGLISKTELDGLDLKWGDGDAAIAMLHKIGKREGIGFLLGEGTKKMGEHWGSEAMDLAPQVKGLEFAAHDPRAKMGTALSYATSARGACHMSSASSNFESGFEMPDMGYPESPDRFEVEGKPEFIMKLQNFTTMFDTIPCCKFMAHNGVPLKSITKIFDMVTGFSLDENDFLETGSRIFNLKRLYNVKCGITRNDDTLPKRFLNMTIEGAEKIHKEPPLERMLEEFYRLRGWDEQGRPRSDTAKKYEIEEYI